MSSFSSSFSLSCSFASAVLLRVVVSVLNVSFGLGSVFVRSAIATYGIVVFGLICARCNLCVY